MQMDNPYQRFRFRQSQPMDEVPNPIPDSSPLLQESPNADAPKWTSGEDTEKPKLPAQSPDDDYFDEIQKLRGNMPISGQYRQLLAAPPSRDQYKPSGMRRFGAAVAAGLTGYGSGTEAGMRAGSEVLDSPYNNAMKDYTTKASTLGRGADLEQKDVDNSVQAMMEARRLGLSVSEFGEKQRHNLNDEATARLRANAAAHTANKVKYLPQQMASGVRMVNEADPKDYYDLPGQTVASVNAQTSQGMLGVARTNAGANVQRANIEGDRNKWQQTNAAGQLKVAQDREAAYAARGAGAKNVSPLDQTRARDAALRELAADPLYRDMIDTSNKDYPAERNDLDGQEQMDLEDELNDRVDRILSRKR